MTRNPNDDGSRPDLPLLDKTVLIDRLETNGPRQRLNELVGLFIAEMRQRIQDIELAGRSLDYKRLEIESHTLKSTCASFGALRLQEFARQLEYASRNQDAAALKLISPLLACATETEATIGQFLA